HPPGGDEDNFRKLFVNFEVGLEPDLRIEEVIHVLEAKIAGDPGAIDDERHRNFVEFLKPRRSLEDVPLFRFHSSLLIGLTFNLAEIQYFFVTSDNGLIWRFAQE